MWKDIFDSKALAVSSMSYMGRRVEVMGRLPKQGSVLLASDGFVTEETCKAMYVSALEASLSGQTVITVAEHRGMSSVIKGTEDGGGELHIFAASAFGDYLDKARDNIQAALVSGGSVLCCPERHVIWSLALANSALFLGTVMGRSYALERALETGVDVALLRSSLVYLNARRYAKEGCPVVDSYSSLFQFPEVIAYETEKGYYGFHGRFFDIMRLL